MSDHERTGERDLTYSKWHRQDSVSRYIPGDAAWGLGLVDIDGCEYCRACGKPLALIETQASAREPKTARVMQELAAMAGIDAYSVSYQKGRDGEIELFRVRQVHPGQGVVQVMLPNIYAVFLHSLRINHRCAKQAAA